MIKWSETAGQTVAVMAFQFHRNGTVLTGMRTTAHAHPQHLGPRCGLTGMSLNIGLFLVFFTPFCFYSQYLLMCQCCKKAFLHIIHTYVHTHTPSSAVFLLKAIIPLQDRQINYGFLDLETIMAARPPQWSLEVSWLPLPASLKRHVSGWHH